MFVDEHLSKYILYNNHIEPIAILKFDFWSIHFFSCNDMCIVWSQKINHFSISVGCSVENRKNLFWFVYCIQHTHSILFICALYIQKKMYIKRVGFWWYISLCFIHWCIYINWLFGFSFQKYFLRLMGVVLTIYLALHFFQDKLPLTLITGNQRDTKLSLQEIVEEEQEW